MDSNNSVILQAEGGGWLRFANPVRIVTAWRPEEVMPALMAVEKGVEEDGLFAAGFIAYEAAPALDKAFRTHSGCGVPLVWFGLYARAQPLKDLPRPAYECRVGEWRPAVSRDQYNAAIDRIRRYIAAGDTYQVNYTIRLRSTVEGAPYALFHALVSAQQASHCAFVNTETHSICSASPELFFRLDGDRIVSRPMKGTAPRGLTCDDDEAQAKALRESEKNRAENIMIVDMVRNDVGRIAEADSVHVVRTFDVERYPTVWQMTSTVEARTPAPFAGIIKAMFPCASITGAPKVRTMEIIREIEPEPREIYTGTIGCLAPDRHAGFNVAIRTVVIDRRTGAAEYGVGGGVVWDSVGAQEYEECLTKAKVLTARDPEFELLETLLWTPQDGYFLKDKHLTRIRRTAEYFGFHLSVDDVENRLRDLAATFGAADHRVRLLVGRSGAIRLETSRLDKAAGKEPFRVALARFPVDSRDRFLYHKTTNRRVYEDARATRPDCDDVILYNERGEITESTIANVVVEVGGKRLTPPVKCGLLAGVFRAHLLETGQVEEGLVTVDDLRRASRIFMVNSVRQWVPAVLVEE
jgi:para-aminobenzoate synthetase/4-amino-4-deoxychorismate lyase